MENILKKVDVVHVLTCSGTKILDRLWDNLLNFREIFFA